MDTNDAWNGFVIIIDDIIIIVVIIIIINFIMF